MSEHIYCNAISIKARAFADGNEALNCRITVDAMIDFLRAHADEKGYVNLSIMRRKQTSEHGHTHYAKLWIPRPRDSAQPAEAAKPPPIESPVPHDAAGPHEVEDDLPF